MKLSICALSIIWLCGIFTNFQLQSSNILIEIADEIVTARAKQNSFDTKESITIVIIGERRKQTQWDKVSDEEIAKFMTWLKSADSEHLHAGFLIVYHYGFDGDDSLQEFQNRFQRQILKLFSEKVARRKWARFIIPYTSVQLGGKLGKPFVINQMLGTVS